MICEAEEVLLTTMKFRLTKKDYELFIPKDKDEAKNFLEEESFNLILSDMDYKGMSTFDIINEFKEKKRGHPPLITIGQIEQSDEVMEALSMGASDFVLKPFKPLELLMRIERLLHP